MLIVTMSHFDGFLKGQTITAGFFCLSGAAIVLFIRSILATPPDRDQDGISNTLNEPKVRDECAYPSNLRLAENSTSPSGSDTNQA